MIPSSPISSSLSRLSLLWRPHNSAVVVYRFHTHHHITPFTVTPSSPISLSLSRLSLLWRPHNSAVVIYRFHTHHHVTPFTVTPFHNGPTYIKRFVKLGNRNVYTSTSYLLRGGSGRMESTRVWARSASSFKEESKVEETVDYLKEKKLKLDEASTQRLSAPVEADRATTHHPSTPSMDTSLLAPTLVTTVVAKKPGIWRKLLAECQHYYSGFRLFFMELRISLRLFRKILNGVTLTRRERQQFLRTVSDLFRLLPFSVFVIVPFMEFLLPFAIKLFPNMLPSTFQDKDSKAHEIKQQLKMKLEMAKFLQDSVEEMSLERKSRSGEAVKEFATFMERIRAEGSPPSTEEILSFSQLFEDDLTVDTLTRRQLQALCRILLITPIGPTDLILFQLKMQLRSLHADDILLQREGLDNLTLAELQSAVRERGMRAYGVSKERLCASLEQWIDLHVNEKVPLSLLLLSRTLFLPEHLTTSDQLQATISSLSEEAREEAKLRVSELEGDVDNKIRLEAVRRVEKAIALEKSEAEKAAQQAVKAKALAHEATLDKELHDVLYDRPHFSSTEVPILDEVPSTRAQRKSAISKKLLMDVEEAITDLAEEKTLVSEERDDLEDLKEDVKEYREELRDLDEMAMHVKEANELRQSIASKRLSLYVDRMIWTMENSLKQLERQRHSLQTDINLLEAKIEAKASAPHAEAVKQPEAESIEQDRKLASTLKTHKEAVISVEEVAQALTRIRSIPDKELYSMLAKTLDTNEDGLINVDEALSTIEYLANEDITTLSQEQIREVLKLLSKKEIVEGMEKASQTQSVSSHTTLASPLKAPSRPA